jgi:ADP-heptose:LPS heptosyltransferase
MQCEYYPTTALNIELPKHYVVIHPVQNWESRTWSALNWMLLTQELNKMGVAVISIGKDSGEKGFFNVDKPAFNFEIELGMNLMNKTTISDCYHIIKNAAAVVTMDSGILHLAGCTDTLIVHLGSSIDPIFRAPYRNKSNVENYIYVKGSCGLKCASNMKYGVKQWGDIQGVPPLVGCLENKETFECHPSVNDVIYGLDIFRIL